MARLSIIVPIYNEEPSLRQVLERLLNTPCSLEREWIFVDDCSTDGSAKTLEEFATKYPIQALYFKQNRGKGAAIRAALPLATGDYVMVQDADFEYDPADVPDLLVPLLTDRADAVFGSRFKQTTVQVHRTYHYFVNRWLTLLSNLLSGIYLTDMETCYKILRTDLIRSMALTSDRFGIEIEITAYVAKTTARIVELPIHYYPRTHLRGKKIRWTDGVAAIFHLLRFNLLVSREKAFVGLPHRYSPNHLRKLRAVPSQN